jgi:hypothetical protein
MAENYFEDESSHSNIMYWWHGVIVDDIFWAGKDDSSVSNENAKIHYSKQLEERPRKGFGKRYKVAIVGRHYAVKSGPCSTEADVLEMAEVVYPVTAGSGLGGTRQTAALRHGTHVVGFYADGKEGRNPVILGCFGVNEQNEPIIYGGDPPQFFQLRSGNKGCAGEKLKKVSNENINLQADKRPVESAEGHPLVATVRDRDARVEGGIGEPLKSPYGCETPQGTISKIKDFLQNLSYIINAIKTGSNDLISSLTGSIKGITSQITALANGLVDRMRGYLVNKINNAVKDVMNLLPPFLRPGFNKTTQDALDGLSCAFNNIKNSTLNVVKDLMNQFIDNYVNAPVCAATSFTGALLGNLIGQVNGAIDSAVGAINNALNIGSGFIDSALDVIEVALDLLKLFDCDKDSPKCPATVKWSFWYGPKEKLASIPEGAARLVNDILQEVETALPGSAEGAASNPCKSRQVPCGPPTVQINGGGGSGAAANPVVSLAGNILGLDFSSFGSGYTASPTISVLDSCGTGGGSVIEPIMRPTGTFNEFQEEILEITGAVVLDSGAQYLPAPNGTTGGNGLILSQPSDTILFKTGSTQIINGKEIQGTGYDIYKCGTTIPVKKGDEIYLPSGTTAEIFDSNGNSVQTLNGLGQLTMIKIEASGTLTTPCNPDNIPTIPAIEYPLGSVETVLTPRPVVNVPVELQGTSTGTQITPQPIVNIPVDFPGTPTGTQITPQPIVNVPANIQGTSQPIVNTPIGPVTTPFIQQLNKETYPVVPVIEKVFIKDPGFNYSPGDKILIEDNKGAELEFDINDRGEVTEVKVLNGGIGFNDVPYIFIQSLTGYNFEAVPVFKFIPLSEIDINKVSPSIGAKVISVIDCVGKINE